MTYVFKDKVVLITGASSGIGRELALRLANEGAHLSLAARDEVRLEQTAEACRKRGARALITPTDVSREDQCKILVDRTIAEYDRLDVLINNAGISMFCYFEEQKDLADMERIMRVNYFGAVYCTFYALPHLKESKGQLVGIASLTGKTGVPSRSFYAASKHAMAGFFDSLRIELMGSGVSVTMVYPGFVATEVRERALSGGKSLGTSHLDESKVMSVETCCQLIMTAMTKRKRELVMTSKGKMIGWLKLLAPKMVDKMTLKAIRTGRT